MARKINIRNGKSKNFVYTAPTAKHGKAYMISLIQSIKRKTLQYLMILMQHHLDFKEFLNILMR